MDEKAKNIELTWALFKYMKTQNAAAKALGVSKQRFNYWLNYANEIPLKQVLAMKKLLEKKLKEENPPDFHKEISQNFEAFNVLTLSDRAELAIFYEKKLGNRQGQRNDLKNEAFQGRTDEKIAKLSGFPSKNICRYAKKVVLHGIPELIKAMNQKDISAYSAYQVSHLPQDIQRELVQKTKKEITARLKEVKHSSLTKLYLK